MNPEVENLLFYRIYITVKKFLANFIRPDALPSTSNNCMFTGSSTSIDAEVFSPTVDDPYITSSILTLGLFISLSLLLKHIFDYSLCKSTSNQNNRGDHDDDDDSPPRGGGGKYSAFFGNSLIRNFRKTAKYRYEMCGGNIISAWYYNFTKNIGFVLPTFFFFNRSIFLVLFLVLMCTFFISFNGFII